MIQYVILEDLGVLSREDLDAYCTPNGRLGVPPGLRQSRHRGLDRLARPRACRWWSAWRSPSAAASTDGIIYTVLSDGELQEGSTWEAILMASSLGCSNIVAFVDNNDFQSLGRTSETHPSFYPLADKFQAFGWETVEIDGHDSAAIFDAVADRTGNEPLMVVAKTTKGKGVSYMENVPIWHYRSPNKDEYAAGHRRAGGAAS